MGLIFRTVLSASLAASRSAAWVAILALVSRPANATDVNAGAIKQGFGPVSVGESNVMVIGFLGGFVHRNDPHHPEVQLIRALRQEYPTGVYFGLFENGKVDEARQAILQQLSNKQASPAPEMPGRPAQILLFGHSWGASAVIRLSRELSRDGIPVALTIQVDTVAKPFSHDGVIPPNVAEAVNFYQTHGFIHGRSTITAADPTHTRILGNFRREYTTEPAPCRNFPWYSRLFTRGHIEIECDPRLWLEVEALLRRHLPGTQ